MLMGAEMFDTLTVISPFTAEECKLANSMSHDRFNFCCYIVQLIFCIISLIATVVLFRSREFKRTGSLLSKNLKLLVSVGWLIYICGILVTTYFYGLSFFYYFYPTTACDHIWVAWRCLLFRFIIHYSIVGLSVFHVLLLIERLHSLIVMDVNQRTCCGIIFALFAFFFPLFLVIYMYKNENIFNAYKIYCFAARESIEILTNVTNTLGVLDILATFGDLFLYSYNQILMRKKAHGYALSKSFQMRERQLSIQLIISMSILHTVMFIPFVITYLMNMSFEGEQRVNYLEVTFLIKTFYNMIIPLAFIYLQTRQSSSKVEWMQPLSHQADTHFRELNNQFRYPK